MRARLRRSAGCRAHQLGRTTLHALPHRRGAGDRCPDERLQHRLDRLDRQVPGGHQLRRGTATARFPSRCVGPSPVAGRQVRPAWKPIRSARRAKDPRPYAC